MKHCLPLWVVSSTASNRTCKRRNGLDADRLKAFRTSGFHKLS